jgi:uncharacterized protein
MDLTECMNFVEKTLQDHQKDMGRKFPFRSRVKHTRRVWMWAERLAENREDVDRDVLFTAAIFHDVGYAIGEPEQHQRESAELFLTYAQAHGLDEAFSRQVASCIAIHSDKQRMAHPEELTVEQILLMEADLLDEEGALAICWDGLSCGYQNVTSYEAVYEHSQREWKDKLAHNPMVTEKGKELWQHKQEFVKSYLQELRYDLGLRAE